MITERLDKLGMRERIGLTLAGLALLGVIADRMIVAPLSAANERIAVEIGTQQTALAAARSVVSQEADVGRQFEAVDGILGEALPKAQAIDQMKAEIDSAARASSLVIVSMKHQEPKSETYYDELVVEISEFEASLEGFLKFAHVLSQSGRPYSIKRLSLSPAGDSMIRGSVQVARIMRKSPDGG